MKYFEFLRQHYGLSKKEMAKIMGISLTTYNTRLRGSSIRTTELKKVKDFFNISCSEISEFIFYDKNLSRVNGFVK